MTEQLCIHTRRQSSIKKSARTLNKSSYRKEIRCLVKLNETAIGRDLEFVLPLRKRRLAVEIAIARLRYRAGDEQVDRIYGSLEGIKGQQAPRARHLIAAIA